MFDMPGLLYPAFQKWYSALSSLDRFRTEKNFFDNISSLDSFFSEFRNITFVMQKSLAHTQYFSLYEHKRDKYLSNCKWFVEMRNDTTKQHPFQLIKEVKISVYFPETGIQLLQQQFSVENDTELSTLLDQLKALFLSINPIEVFFSADFSFFEKGSHDDLYDKLILGINAMDNFLKDMYKEIPEKCELCENLISKTSKTIFSHIPKDMLLINDYVYYPQKDIFERAKRIAMQMQTSNGDCAIRGNLSAFDKKPFAPLGNDYFQKFVLMHAILGTADLMPTLMTIYQDNTFTLDSFNADIKTTLYRKINQTASLILSDNIKAVYLMVTYSSIPYDENQLENYLNMTSKERLSLGCEDYLTFLSIDCNLQETEYSFRGSQLKDNAYIFRQITQGKQNKFNLGKINMMPIIEAFQKMIESP